MFRLLANWFEDHYVFGTLIKTMLCGLALGILIGFVCGGLAFLLGYPHLLKPFVCWAICICSGLCALWCVILGLYALIMPKSM